MADGDGSLGSVEVYRFRQHKYIDAVRWLPPMAAFDRLVVTATHDADAPSSSLEIHSLRSDTQSYPYNAEGGDNHKHHQDNTDYYFEQRSTWTSPARISALKIASTSSKAVLAAASRYSGHVMFVVVDPFDSSIGESCTVEAEGQSGICGFDLQSNTCECVCTGMDGVVSIARVYQGNVQKSCVSDSSGLLSYTAARWISPYEFLTAGLGFSLQLWDQRRPGGFVSQSPNKWINECNTGIIHSIDAHSSRKHICVAGGSSGTVFAWDLRQFRQPISLANTGSASSQFSSVISESEIWEVQYDNYTQTPGLGDATNKILPVMICSEDGVLGVLEAGNKPLEILAEPCAINTFDIDKENPSDIVCAAEWERILYLRRS